ncbi:hypothetical protein LB503_011851 [Fusarium chuoi]|nr:hypothetical protein LB503_011851 [Fusarium chuoi]
MQLVDELSMIYKTSILCYAIFTHGRSRLFSISLGIGLVTLSISITYPLSRYSVPEPVRDGSNLATHVEQDLHKQALQDFGLKQGKSTLSRTRGSGNNS